MALNLSNGSQILRNVGRSVKDIVKKQQQTTKANHGNVFRVAKGGSVRKASPVRVTQTGNNKIPYTISGSSLNGTLNINGAINGEGKLAFLNAIHKEINSGKSTIYNLLGGGSRKLDTKTGKYVSVKSAKQFNDLVGEAAAAGVNIPFWAKKDRRRKTTKNNSTYNVENIVPDYSNPLPENIQRSLDLANPNPNISNPQVSNYGRSNPQYQGTTGGSTVKPSVFNMPGPEPIPTGMGPTRQKVDPLTADERETIESLLNETQSKFDAKEITEEQYYSELEEIQNMYTEIENKYWKAEERKYDKRTPEGRQTEFNKKIDDIEKRYANGDLTDDEYISELQKAHDKYDYDSNRPNDHSNVLNNPPEKPLTEEERARKLYEDAMNGNLEEVPEHVREVMDAYRMEDERVAKEAEEKAKADREMEEIKKKEKEIYDNRIYDEDEYKRLEEELIEKFNNGDITEEELKKQWAELDKRYQPITKEELEEQIEEGTKPDARPESNPFHRDMDKFDSAIEKQFKGEGYEGNIKNGYVQDITVGGKTYNIKHRADDNTIDVFDSDGNVIADQDILKDVNSKVFDETNNFYKNLSDEEWDTVINNAKDYRFDKHKASDTITEREAKMLNTNDAIEKRKAILDEQREAIVKNAETAKGKKKKEALNKQRNTIDIKKREADRIKKTNEHKLEAGQRRRAARSKFNKTLGLDAFEEGSQEFKDALNALKGTDEYVEAMAKFKKDLKGIDKMKRSGIKETNRIIDAEISALSGKGLTINNAITVASAAIGAVNKYKESRAEGKGVVSSAARAGATAIAAEVLGPGAAVAVMGARMAGNALTEAGDAIYKENRRMNSASNFRVFGGASFQDSQELATMRQSGMELAKMSQYNLEQTLMGAEAKHLHR